jgi:hypothetical protein
MPPKPKPEYAAATFRRYASGESAESIAASEKKTREALYRLWTRHGFTWRRPRKDKP